MYIPKRIKIGAIYYDVVYPDVQDMDENGDCNQGNCKITVNPLAPEMMQEKICWHEMIHAWNINWEEEMVESMAQMITTVVHDNGLYNTPRGYDE